MTESLTRRAGMAAALTLVCAASVAAQVPAGTPQAAKAAPVFVNGMAQVVPAFADSGQWIRQNLWVETDFDSDRDGRNDRVHVAVTRPRQTETEGLRVPVVYGSSPYYAGVARTFAFWNVRQELGDPSPPRGAMLGPPHDSTRTRISNQLVRTWVPRGFAVVHSDAPGTGRSQGCVTIGDTPERTAMKFVIDWLNGRAKGYTTPDGSEQVSATSWSTGRVGMIGTSYEGTLPLAAATTGVAGLEVVVPVSANTSYYHYYRSNGLVRSPGGYLGEDVDVLYDFVASGPPATRAVCDRIWKGGVFAAGQDRRSGDFNDFWAARELLPHVGNIRAAVLLAHGLNDFNVMPSHSVRVYEAMKARGLPVSMYLHQGGHGGDPPFDMLNRWFTHYLYGVDNGVRADPPVWIVSSTAADSAAASARASRTRGTMPAPVPFAAFPAPGSEPVRLHPTPGGNGIAPLALRPLRGIDSIADDAAVTGSANAGAPRSAHRLLFATAPLTDTLRISGTARVTIRVAADRPAANLSVWLVTLPYDSARAGDAGRAGVVTRGWADIQNHASLTRGGVYDSRRPGEPLVPGRYYDLTFDLEPDDQVIPAGRQLGIMIMSSDPEFTLWPRAGTRLTVDLAGTSFSLPVVGGRAALLRAGAVRRDR
ncbi:MAG TPA: Xaa-Pro dipeptidyl-peptidase [Longimicrobium sp.]|nr:Xaa-Pro dipeptidyl-peptidase [Longimicrobium sp.]